ncbi:uncharacterized protein PADG_11897 [Paracoccidioides brasiliensis Pb18]|uniref:Uncharacterized protein n=1 Tax=Paracoccidioides brasiliensis (strain Pb18) TaxID=502780 RepID=A0A0A0HRT7_PARBD|nr:uncharacterized protein PADG_11897 [Paracoccidioides brasiliensis Pb18]KGM91924.1 hypothetical protein PADG_11897 [Paracoccidioides brasiliensis Pb18]
MLIVDIGDFDPGSQPTSWRLSTAPEIGLSIMNIVYSLFPTVKWHILYILKGPELAHVCSNKVKYLVIHTHPHNPPKPIHPHSQALQFEFLFTFLAFCKVPCDLTRPSWISSS